MFEIIASVLSGGATGIIGSAIGTVGRFLEKKQELKQMKLDRIVVITGSNNEKFELKNVQYIKDVNYNEHDILGSLMEAKDYIKNDVLILYSDIIFYN